MTLTVLTRKITFDLDPFREKNARNYNTVESTLKLHSPSRLERR